MSIPKAYQARAKEVVVIPTEESAWIGRECLCMPRNHCLITGADVVLEVIVLEYADHVHIVLPRVVGHKKIRVVGEELDNGRAGPRARHATMA